MSGDDDRARSPVVRFETRGPTVYAVLACGHRIAAKTSAIDNLRYCLSCENASPYAVLSIPHPLVLR